MKTQPGLNAFFDNLAIEQFFNKYNKPSFGEVLFLIPAYNERDSILKVINEIPKAILGLEASVLVILDGSTDDTALLLDENKIFYANQSFNRGQGAALRIGYKIASLCSVPYIVTLDADGQSSPNDFEKIISKLLEGYDMVFGSRSLGNTQSKDFMRNLGVLVFARLISLLTKKKITDPANPLRAMKTSKITGLSLEENQFQAGEVLVSALLNSYLVCEVPVTMKRRFSGRSKKPPNVLYGYNYLKCVLRTYLRERQLLKSHFTS